MTRLLFSLAARRFCLRTALWLALISGGLVQPSTAGPITVSFTAPLNGGLVAHEAIRVSSDTFTNTIGYNSKPVLAPFLAADGVGGRYAVHPDAAAVNLDFSYMALDGAGAFTFNQSGTTLFSGFPIPYGAGAFSAAGSGLPLAAHTGQLSTALVLPNGLTLAAGTTLYSDLAGFHADFNDPASYWYDSGSHIEHRTYTGGKWAFFYEDPDSPGSYQKLAEYHDVVFDWEINFLAGTLSNTWTGIPVAVDGLILPASVSGYGLTSPINTTGILSNELTSPFTGFYGRFRDTYNITFDVDNAKVVSAVPEPASLALFAVGGLAMLARRRIGRNEYGPE
jgi:hypothetical protein